MQAIKIIDGIIRNDSPSCSVGCGVGFGGGGVGCGVCCGVGVGDRHVNVTLAVFDPVHE